MEEGLARLGTATDGRQRMAGPHGRSRRGQWRRRSSGSGQPTRRWRCSGGSLERKTGGTAQGEGGGVDLGLKDERAVQGHQVVLRPMTARRRLREVVHDWVKPPELVGGHGARAEAWGGHGTGQQGLDFLGSGSLEGGVWGRWGRLAAGDGRLPEEEVALGAGRPLEEEAALGAWKPLEEEGHSKRGGCRKWRKWPGGHGGAAVAWAASYFTGVEGDGGIVRWEMGLGDGLGAVR